MTNDVKTDHWPWCGGLFGLIGGVYLFVWSRNPMRHNDDIVFVWGSVCVILHIKYERKLPELYMYELILIL